MDDTKHPQKEKTVNFKANLLDSNSGNVGWIILITILSFFLSITLSFVSSNILQNVTVSIAFCVVLIIIFINIIFDIIGTAVTAADEAPFHAMASRKLSGAKRSIRLIRNADKVSNFCNDVVGDICGVISGAASTLIIMQIVKNDISVISTVLGLIITGFVAALTVGGKAIGKSIAIQNANYIIYKVSVILNAFSGKLNIRMFDSKKKSKVR